MTAGRQIMSVSAILLVVATFVLLAVPVPVPVVHSFNPHPQMVRAFPFQQHQKQQQPQPQQQPSASIWSSRTLSALSQSHSTVHTNNNNNQPAVSYSGYHPPHAWGGSRGSGTTVSSSSTRLLLVQPYSEQSTTRTVWPYSSTRQFTLLVWHSTRFRSSTMYYQRPLSSGISSSSTSNDDNDNNMSSSSLSSRLTRGIETCRTAIALAQTKFLARPVTFLLIPCIAALVGWLTNWLAVQMIFYPIQYWGIPLLVRPEMPLGLLGWQGIVPCKTRPMTIALTDMVTSQLLTVSDAFARLDPKEVANLLVPHMPELTKDVVSDLLPSFVSALPRQLTGLVSSWTRPLMAPMHAQFVQDLTIGLQQHANDIFSLQNCVVSQMLSNRAQLGALFQSCCRNELDFLTNSGLWFGFLLGVIQMIVALFWNNPWSLSIGGGIVGLATNWLALKWIFEPVDPVQWGPWLIQGKFLRRQREVAAEFSRYFSQHILTGEQMWHSILTDPETKPAFLKVVGDHVGAFVDKIPRAVRRGGRIEAATIAHWTQGVVDKLPLHVPVLFPYMDQALGLEQTLRRRMEGMSSRKFERVLHPIFEQDELTLIIAGAVLGFMAGLVQQGLETGTIRLPNLVPASVGRTLKRWRLRIRHRIDLWTDAKGRRSTE